MAPVDKTNRSKKSIEDALSAIPRETTPLRISAGIERLCSRLVEGGEPLYVEVKPTADAKPAESYANVAAQVEDAGGQSEPGWLIWHMPAVLLNAERHCCWRSPDGTLLDITPKPDLESRILFVADDSPWDGGRVCPAVEPLSAEQPVLDYVAAFLAEREQWAQGVEDFQLKKNLYDSLTALNEHLAAKADPRRKRKKR